MVSGLEHRDGVIRRWAARLHPTGLENPVTEAESPRRHFVRIEALIDDGGSDPTGLATDWRQAFLEKLAETSNVAESAEAAGVAPSTAYRRRRQDAAFARDWRSALAEGYEHLELETLHRLRAGTGKDDPKFDIANALRILALHKDAVAQERGGRETRDEEAILASIDAKLERMRAREENVARLLRDDGVSAPRLSGGNE